MTVRPILSDAYREEYRRRCERIALDPDPEEMTGDPRHDDAVGVRARMRLAIMVEVTSGKLFTFDPVMAAAGEPDHPPPQWLINSRGGNI